MKHPHLPPLCLAAALFLILCACTGPGQSSAAAQGAPPTDSQASSAVDWWEEPDWLVPQTTLEAEGLKAEIYGPHQVRFTLADPRLQESYRTDTFEAVWILSFYLPDGTVGSISTPFRGKPIDTGAKPVEELEWRGVQDLKVLGGEKEIVFYVRDEDYDFTTVTALAASIEYGGELTRNTYYPVEEDGTLGTREPAQPDFDQKTVQYRYLQLDTLDTDSSILTLYGDGAFRLVQVWAPYEEENTIWGEWEDGNTAVTLRPNEQFFGPNQEFRLDKTDGLRVYAGGGPGSLPLEKGAAFQKVGDLLELEPFDSAVVSKVTKGDRPAIFLDRAEDETLMRQFQEMMKDAAELKNPQWTEDPADRPNLQFDLNINGENITMVLCPCVVEGTKDKYLLVQKNSYMGRVTYTYYQTRRGGDYDRMDALFEEQYKKTPQVLTEAMAAQLRAQTAAISNLDWSQEFPLDANGVPISYKTVFRSQKATGYWRDGNPYGAGSRTAQAKTGVYHCTAGTVAVRPDQIPYGSKLYIRTAGGGFIYGYAVANDTGSGLVDGLIDVDLFYDSYQESVMNSVRWVDVYVLE